MLKLMSTMEGLIAYSVLYKFYVIRVTHHLKGAQYSNNRAIEFLINYQLLVFPGTKQLQLPGRTSSLASFYSKAATRRAKLWDTVRDSKTKYFPAHNSPRTYAPDMKF